MREIEDTGEFQSVQNCSMVHYFAIGVRTQESLLLVLARNWRYGKVDRLGKGFWCDEFENLKLIFDHPESVPWWNNHFLQDRSILKADIAAFTAISIWFCFILIKPCVLLGTWSIRPSFIIIFILFLRSLSIGLSFLRDFLFDIFLFFSRLDFLLFVHNLFVDFDLWVFLNSFFFVQFFTHSYDRFLNNNIDSFLHFCRHYINDLTRLISIKHLPLSKSAISLRRPQEFPCFGPLLMLPGSQFNNQILNRLVWLHLHIFFIIIFLILLSLWGIFILFNLNITRHVYDLHIFKFFVLLHIWVENSLWHFQIFDFHLSLRLLPIKQLRR